MVGNKGRVEVARKETIIIPYRYLALAGRDGKSGVGRGPLGCWLQSVASRSLTTHGIKKGPFKFAKLIRRLESLVRSLAPVLLPGFHVFSSLSVEWRLVLSESVPHKCTEHNLAVRDNVMGNLLDPNDYATKRSYRLPGE